MAAGRHVLFAAADSDRFEYGTYSSVFSLLGLFFFALFLHLLLLCAGCKKLRELRQDTHARRFKVQRIAWRIMLRIAAYFVQASGMLDEVKCDR